jgi:hypothetical protein
MDALSFNRNETCSLHDIGKTNAHLVKTGTLDKTKRQSRMDNPEKLATLATQEDKKQELLTPSLAPEFTPGFWSGPYCSSFSVFCLYVLCTQLCIGELLPNLRYLCLFPGKTNAHLVKT